MTRGSDRWCRRWPDRAVIPGVAVGVSGAIAILEAINHAYVDIGSGWNQQRSSTELREHICQQAN